MNIPLMHSYKNKSLVTGNALISVVILTLLASSLVGSYLSLSIHETKTVRLDIDRQKAELAAEAGLDYGINKLREAIFNYQFNPSIGQSQFQTQLNAISPPDPLGDYVYETPDGASAFKIIVQTPAYQGTVTKGSAFRGVNATIQHFSVVCGARNAGSGASSVLRQDLQAIGLALIRFGVFYEEDLEILPGPTMIFEGPVHSNADIYIGGPVQFHDRVTAHGDIRHRRKNDGSRLGEARAADGDHVLRSFRDPDGTWIDSDHPDWMLEAIQRWDGNIQSADHGMSRLTPPISPIDEPYSLIERPLPSSSTNYSALTEHEKFANKAGLTIHVDSSGILHATNALGNNVSHHFRPAVLDETSGEPAKDSDGKYVMLTNGTHEIENSRFFDARENRWISPVDIYIDQLQEDYPNIYTDLTSDEGRGIIYITRDDPLDGTMPAVRLRNGNAITNALGMTIVSDLPVYIEGNFNTSNTVPALIAGDAITLLSGNWQDDESTGSQNDRRASNTEYFAVLMTGNTETTWGSYNGGLENVIRMLEHWSSRTLYFRGSIIDLWYSQKADGPWAYGTSDGRFRYTAPVRNWGYDAMYRTLSPPGMTHVFGIEETSWERTTWDEQGW